MHRVLVLGAGKIGALISGLLAESGSYKVHLADVDGAAAEGVVRAHGTGNLTGFAFDASQAAALARHLAEHPADAVISSLPYYCNFRQKRRGPYKGIDRHNRRFRRGRRVVSIGAELPDLSNERLIP